MNKYDRIYNFMVQRDDGQTMQVKLPFTIEFDIHRASFGSTNVAQFRIYNLNEQNRNQLRFDWYDYDGKRLIEFMAGYDNNLSLSFKGNITRAWSVREGVDWVSTVESFDGGFAFVNSTTDKSFPAGTQQQAIIDSFANDLKSSGVSIGAIGKIDGEISRGNSFSGSTMTLLSENTGSAAFIDNGKINVLKDNECIQTTIPVINAQSGLLGTPIKEQEFISIEMLFEPSLRIGQLINLQSQTTDAAKIVNGIHKVVGLHHRGTISAAVCGNATTSVKLLSGSIGNNKNAFTPVQSRS